MCECGCGCAGEIRCVKEREGGRHHVSTTASPAVLSGATCGRHRCTSCCGVACAALEQGVIRNHSPPPKTASGNGHHVAKRTWGSTHPCRWPLNQHTHAPPPNTHKHAHHAFSAAAHPPHTITHFVLRAAGTARAVGVQASCRPGCSGGGEEAQGGSVEGGGRAPCTGAYHRVFAWVVEGLGMGPDMALLSPSLLWTWVVYACANVL